MHVLMLAAAAAASAHVVNVFNSTINCVEVFI